MISGRTPVAAVLQHRVAHYIAAAARQAPLTSILVVVDRPADAELLRRQLVGRGLLPGLVNVQFRTVDELCDILLPIGSELVARAVVHSEMERRGGAWREIAGHPGTVAAMTDAARRLRHLPPAPDVEGLDQQVVDVVAIATGATGELAQLAGPKALPQPQTAIVVALRVPAPVEQWLGTLPHVVVISDPPADAEPAPREVSVYSCPDPYAEADVVARLVVDSLNAPGARADTVAVLVTDEEGLMPAIQDALDVAGVLWYSANAVPLATTAAARSVVGLLDVLLARGEGAVGRPELFAWWSGTPVVRRELPLPTSAWRSFIRRQNLYGDAFSWTAPLAELADHAVGRDGAPDETARRQAAEVSAFLRDLDEALQPLLAPASWSEAAAGLYELWIGYHDIRALQYQDEERAALQRIRELLLVAASGLDQVGDRFPPTLLRLREFLVEELAASIRAGDPARGVRLSTLEDGLVGVFATTVLAGMREGCVPIPPRHDPLLPDDARTRLRDRNGLRAVDLPTSAELAHWQERAFRSVRSSALEVAATLSRSSLRGRTRHKPSRFLPREAVDGAVVVESYGSLAVPRATDLRQWPADALALERRVASHRALDDPQANGYFGRLLAGPGGRVVDIAAPDRQWSATAIESFLHCPYGFFVERILKFRVEAVEDELGEMRANDFGTLLHDSLQEFVIAERDSGLLPAGGQPWPQGAAGRLSTTVQRHIQAVESKGLQGRNPGWLARKQELLDCLDDLLVVDGAARAGGGFPPGAPEQGFGAGHESVVLPVGAGRSMALVGSIDRLDHAQGRALVIDYKSGSSQSMQDQIKTGRKVQHLLYGYAASQLLSTTVDQVQMAYLFAPNHGTPGIVTVPVDAAALADVVRSFDDELSAGRFPPRPEGERDYCRVCAHLGRTALYAADSWSAYSGGEPGADGA